MRLAAEGGFEGVELFFQLPELALFGGAGRKEDAMMEPVRTIEGGVEVVDRADVDTDQIIPKQFLKRIERTGFGEFLFYDWRREGLELESGCPDPGGRAQLRLRLVPRARRLGDRGLRLQGRRRSQLRRHLL